MLHGYYYAEVLQDFTLKRSLTEWKILRTRNKFQYESMKDIFDEEDIATLLTLVLHALREEPIQIKVILQQKLPAATLSTCFTVYKQ